MSESTDAEKKHAPTAAKLRQAREQGQIRRSNDLPKAATTLLLILLVTGLGGAMTGMAFEWMRASLENAGSRSFRTIGVLDLEFAGTLTAFLLAVGVLSFGAGIASGGWMMSMALLAPKFERIDPAKSWGQVFSISNLIEVGKSALKICVIGGAGYLAYRAQRFNLLALGSPRQITLAALGGPAFAIMAAATGGGAVLAGVDVGVQAWLNRRALRMTDQELKEDTRNAEGDPHVRARRRAIMRRAARARQTQAVRTASMVITNPTHYAVAVRYRRHIDAVPVVVAKGVDLAAQPILEEARVHGIPLVEAPPLARALHRQVEVDAPVPTYLYRAVAEVLAYIWKIETWKAQGGARPVRPAFQEDSLSPSDARSA